MRILPTPPKPMPDGLARHAPCNADMASVRRQIMTDWPMRASVGRQARSVEADKRNRDRAAQRHMDEAREAREMLRSLI